jgi:hypothetical protein
MPRLTSAKHLAATALLAAMVLHGSSTAPAWAQTERIKSQRHMDLVRNRGNTALPLFSSGVFSGIGYTGMKTRLDVLREFDGLTTRATDRYKNMFISSPMRQMLNDRSNLHPRSNLGKLVSDQQGYAMERAEGVDRMPRIGDINERIKEDNDHRKAPTDPGAPLEHQVFSPIGIGGTLFVEPQVSVGPDGLIQTQRADSYQDFLERRIRQKADDAYETGLGYAQLYDPFASTRLVSPGAGPSGTGSSGASGLGTSRSSNALTMARSYFEMYRSAMREDPKGYFAVGIVSFANGDFAQSYASLRGGILLVKTADDLHPDQLQRDRFFKDPSCFRELFDRASALCAARNERDTTGVILSYFAFLYGDLPTALSAAEQLETLPDPELVAVAKTYRKALAEAGEAKTGEAKTGEAKTGEVKTGEVKSGE